MNAIRGSAQAMRPTSDYFGRLQTINASNESSSSSSDRGPNAGRSLFVQAT